MSTTNSMCDDQLVREISQVLVNKSPEAFFETIADKNAMGAGDKECDEMNGGIFSDAGFEDFTHTYLVADAVKKDCYLAYLDCVKKANKALGECSKKAKNDLDKLKACVDQHAASLKACIDTFEKCKKQDG